MRRSLLAFSISSALLSYVSAQPIESSQAPSNSEANVPVTYVGTNGRISLGINDHGDVAGEGLGVFGYNGEHAWLGQLWLGQGGAGGVQLDYHWLWGGKTRQDSIDQPDSVAVSKVFIAADQNQWHDRKLTVGAGYEKQNFFFDGYLMGALTGQRFVNSITDQTIDVLSGSDSLGPYTQTQTTTTITDFFEHPYNYGAGAHIGKYFDEPLLRLRGGLDYEVGHNNSDQVTFSLGLDKYIRNTGWSFTLEGEHVKKSGDFETDRTDNRGWLWVRYEFGQSFRAREPYKMVQMEKSVAPSASMANGQPQVMRNEVKLDGDAFFDFDKAQLQPGMTGTLNDLVAKLKSGVRVSRVKIVGHTCDIGSAAYNQKLSERRANAVRSFLIAQGVAADEIEARGEGLRNPKYPNDTRANRKKNRRVDIEFLTVEETTVAAAPAPATTQPSAIEWVKQPVPMPAAWIERALRNPAEHKRTVDVYKIEKQSSSVALGPKVYLNHPPIAQNDAATVPENSSNNSINVLANDSDPDGNPLTITSISNPAHGTAAIVGSLVNYTPVNGFTGSDTFTYSISDGQGGTASATVSVTVTGTANRAPVAQNDVATTVGTAPVTITVLANDSDPDGDVIHVTTVAKPAHGVATSNANGTVAYVASEGFVGIDTFSYTIQDSQGAQATAQVSVTVTAPVANQPPVANDDQFFVLKGAVTNLNVLTNDSDPEGDALKIVSVTHTGLLTAEVSINPDGSVRYMHHHGTQGVDSFTYTISDGHGNTATANVIVNVFEIPIF